MFGAEWGPGPVEHVIRRSEDSNANPRTVTLCALSIDVFVRRRKDLPESTKSQFLKIHVTHRHFLRRVPCSSLPPSDHLFEEGRALAALPLPSCISPT